MNIGWLMEHIDAYCNQIANQKADDDSDENYTKVYKAAYKDCLEVVINKARGTLL
jgi:hypothetical protein